jgi:general secretion pathway protein K
MTRWTLEVTDRPVKTPDARRPRGVALLLSLVTIAILSAAVVEFSYQNRVNLALASNERDQLKAYFLARSAVNISKLLLSFQFALSSEARETEDDMGRLIGRAMRRSNFQMYQYIDLLMGPFNSGQIESPIGGISLNETGVEGFGDFTGEMNVKVVPEEGRFDVNSFAKAKLDEDDLSQMCVMLLDSQYDDLFERKDDNGELLDRATILQRIIDHVDANEESVVLGNDCTVRGSSGDEMRPYDGDIGTRRKNRPPNRKVTHLQELYKVPGIGEDFMAAFEDQLTVYPVGKPNVNVAQAPVFYSVLCRHVRVQNQNNDEGTALDLCARDPSVGMQVFWFALALDGVRAFFENPLSVLLAYVGSTESKLLPSAKKGQPVAFLSVSQFPNYVKDFQNSPPLMAQFVQYSPLYQQMALTNPKMVIDPLNPQFPAWTVDFDKSGLMKSVTVSTPKIYRIYATGQYGTTETTIEAVIDFDKTIRRLPDEDQLEVEATDDERFNELREALKEQRKSMPKGRWLYWREY